jgi:hypothetical protein
MKKDLPKNIVQEISVAVVLENETPDGAIWGVYIINLKDHPIETVIIASKGYGLKDGEEVKTSVLRHMLPLVEAKSFAKIELIDPQVFGLTNEYWVSYYVGKEIYDKKFIFLPESIIDNNFNKIPLINKPGVMIGK